ncbi:MAG TPA: hypothetical protein VK816_08080 [Jatrophihabitantaceae bacterium]|jgi:hypothetical protein|nr:hypothetical protein [Jatrophihabitantaceae bacterium]
MALAAGRAVRQVEPRVAASVTQLGLVARLIAPALALVVATGYLPTATLSEVWWQGELGAAFPLSLPDATGGSSTPRSVSTTRGAALIRAELIGGPVRALTDAVTETVPVSRLVLQGNIASAINSASTLIGSQRADLRQASRAVADALLRDPELNPLQNPSGPAFRRSSCCLIYRAGPGRSATAGSTCGDCILTSSPR